MLAWLQFYRVVAVKGSAHRETRRTYKMGSACFTTHVNPRVSVYLLCNLDVFYFARQYIRHMAHSISLVEQTR